MEKKQILYLERNYWKREVALSCKMDFKVTSNLLKKISWEMPEINYKNDSTFCMTGRGFAKLLAQPDYEFYRKVTDNERKTIEHALSDSTKTIELQSLLLPDWPKGNEIKNYKSIVELCEEYDIECKRNDFGQKLIQYLDCLHYFIESGTKFMFKDTPELRWCINELFLKEDDAVKDKAPRKGRCVPQNFKPDYSSIRRATKRYISNKSLSE